jgi:hypothetical protein
MLKPSGVHHLHHLHQRIREANRALRCELEREQFPLQARPLLLNFSVALQLTTSLLTCFSHAHLQTRLCGRLSSDSQTCDCTLFSGPSRSSVTNNWPSLKMALGYPSPSYGSQVMEVTQWVFLPRLTVTHRNSLFHKIPSLDFLLIKY